MFYYCSRVHYVVELFTYYYTYSFVLNLREFFDSVFFLVPDLTCADYVRIKNGKINCP